MEICHSPSFILSKADLLNQIGGGELKVVVVDEAVLAGVVRRIDVDALHLAGI